MLPSKAKSALFLFRDELYVSNPKVIATWVEAIYQHLYFLSDEEIKEGDIIMNNLDFLVGKCIKRLVKSEIETKEYSKIIATTDKSLGLPEPSKEFIEIYVKAYNEGKPITEVLVEYEYIAGGRTAAGPDVYKKGFGYQLKVKSDNTITIKKVKDSCSRKEVEELFWKAHQEGIIEITTYTKENFTKWLEQNL